MHRQAAKVDRMENIGKLHCIRTVIQYLQQAVIFSGVSVCLFCLSVFMTTLKVINKFFLKDFYKDIA